MNISITQKLFLAILTAAGIAILCMVLTMQTSISRGFLRFVNTMERTAVPALAAKLEENYRSRLNWDFVSQDPVMWRQLIVASIPDESPHQPEPPMPMDRPRRGPRHMPMVRNLAQRLFLLNADKTPLLALGDIPAKGELTPLRYNNEIVGYLGLIPSTNISDQRQKRFLKEQKNSLILVAGVIVLVAAGISLMLAKRLVKPIGELAKATDILAAGDFSIRVPVNSNDELGRLGEDFNALAAVLAKNEQTRRQWVADISHELRTPLAVLRGEIEALEDGIRPPTKESLRSLHGEVLRLGHLVDDLYQLSLTDLGAMTFQKRDLELSYLLAETVESYRQRFTDKGIVIMEDILGSGDVNIMGDPERMRQLFANIMENSLNYTNSGGHLKVAIECNREKVCIDFHDSVPGVPESELERLFERLYRVESSRNRATGGAGLGLAICRNIVDAHNGSIIARKSPAGGIWIRIELPRIAS
jgi:two-component system sensor histidine kinase BaeS